MSLGYFLLILIAIVSAQKIAIFGAGIGGMTAAQELLEKNPALDISIYERLLELGGKSRSNKFPGTGRDGRADLDGEHGFRIIPSFYQNLVDTLDKIPFANGKNVTSNLVQVEEFMSTNDKGADPVIGVAPNSVLKFVQFLQSQMRVVQAFKIPQNETYWFVQRVMIMASSCPARYNDYYDSVPYWKYVQGDRLTRQTQALIVHGLTKVLFASEGKIASLRTMGLMLVRLLFGTLVPSPRGAPYPWIRLMNQPTNDAWIHPWIKHLRSLGVKFYPGVELKSFSVDPINKRVTGAKVQRGNAITEIVADQYISAIPGEKMAKVVTPELARVAPSLSKIDSLLFWGMNGIQYYLREDVPVVRGHVHGAFSKWSLAMVSQRQFWNGSATPYQWDRYGDGTVKGILSLCISAWDVRGEVHGPSKGKPAKDCTKQEIIDEVWYQLHLSLPKMFDRDWRRQASLAFLDPAIRFERNGTFNEEPLYIDSVNATLRQPKARTELNNLYMASDYIYTDTALASMEAANEAARVATTHLLKDLNWTGSFPKVFKAGWPDIFEFYVNEDCERYKQGKDPWGWNATPDTLNLPELFQRINLLTKSKIFNN